MAETFIRTKQISLFVGIAASLVSMTVGGISVWTFLVPKPDTQFNRMISTAEGMKTALERMVLAIEAEPALVGGDKDSVKTLAETAQSVTESVQTAAASQGIKITPADLWGKTMVVKDGAPVLLENSKGTVFGIGRSGALNLYFNGSHRYVNEGDVHRFEVGQDKCAAFVAKVESGSTTLSVTCE